MADFQNVSQIIEKIASGDLKEILSQGNGSIYFSPEFCQGFKHADLSCYDLSKIDIELLMTIPFSTETKWPRKLPQGFDPKILIEAGKN